MWVGVDRREALGDLQRFAVEVAGLVEPGLVAEAHRVDDQRVAFPPAARVAHPEIEILHVRRAVQEHRPRGVGELVGDADVLRRLRDLERERQVGRARHAGHVALPQRIGHQPVLEVLVPLGQRPGW